MPQHDDALSPTSTPDLRSLALTYFAKNGVSRLTRSELVPFFLSQMTKEEVALFASKLRRSTALPADIAAARHTVHRKMRERYGAAVFGKYLQSQIRLSVDVLREYDVQATVPPGRADSSSMSDDDSLWPEILPQGRKDALLEAFRKGTNIEVGPTCAVCARRTFSQDLLFTPKHLTCQRVLAHTLPLDLLRIEDAHILARPGGHFDFDDVSLNGIAFDSSGLHASDNGTEADVCNECLSHLSNSPPTLPALALANGNIRGRLPDALQDCTWMEERLCARILASAYIVRLYDVTYKDGAKQPEHDTRPRIMRGHTCAFPLNTVATASALPWSFDGLGPMVSCLVIGPRKPRPSDLRNVFTVRRQKVKELLFYLRDNCKDYPQISIDWEALQALPEDGVPDDIMRQIIFEPSDNSSALFDQETAGLEAHPALVDVDEAAMEEGMTYLEHHGLVDVNGLGLSADARMASALVNATGGERPDIILKHGSGPISSYNNPALFPGMFPLLFPWGIGGFEEKRSAPLSLTRQAKYLLDLADSSFRRHWSFIFVVANIKQRRTIHVGSNIACQSKDFAKVSRALDDLDAATVKRVAEHLSLGGKASSLTPDERRVFTLLKKCELLSAQVPGSKAIMNRARADIRSYIGEYGIFQLFLTLNPHPEYSPTFQVFFGDTKIDLNLPAPLRTKLSKRQAQVADDPVAAADYFHFHIAAVFQYLFGWDVRAGRSSDDGGLLGQLAAFFMVREHTMRGQLHGHILIWLKGGLNPSVLRGKLGTDDGFRDRYLAWLDDIIFHHLPGPIRRRPPTSNTLAQPRGGQTSSEADCALDTGPTNASEQAVDDSVQQLLRDARDAAETHPADETMQHLPGAPAGPLADAPEQVLHDAREDCDASDAAGTGPADAPMQQLTGAPAGSLADASDQVFHDASNAADRGPADSSGPVTNFPTQSPTGQASTNFTSTGDTEDDDSFGEGPNSAALGSNPREMTPPDPKNPDFRRRFNQDHQRLGEQLQRHRHRKTCYKGGRTSCRYLYPHDLEEETRFDPETKSIIMRVKDATINWHNDYILVATRHNHDLKAVQSGQSSVAAAAYITGYATKSDETPANQVSMISTVFNRLEEQSEFHLELKALLTRCVMQFGRERQLHAQQVATYVRDLGDVWQSHKTIPMLSGSMLNKVFGLFGEPRSKCDRAYVLGGGGEEQGGDEPESQQHPSVTAQQANEGQQGEDPEDEDVEQHEDFHSAGRDGGEEGELLSLHTSGRVHQIVDYLYRAPTIEEVCFYDFVKYCHLVPIPKNKQPTHHSLHPGHPKAKTHVHRYTPDQPRAIPRAVFASFPRSDGTATHGDRYCAAMLCHFQPFSISRPLKNADMTYEKCYEVAKFSASSRRIIDNWQALAECDDARDQEQLLRRKREAIRSTGHDKQANGLHGVAGLDDPDADVNAAALTAKAAGLSAETMLFLSRLSRSGWFHASKTTGAQVTTVGLNEHCPVFSPSRRRQWAKEQDRIEMHQRELMSMPKASSGVLAQDLNLDQDFGPTATTDADDMPGSEDCGPGAESLPSTERRIWHSQPPHVLIEKLIKERSLNSSQALAFKIVARHFFQEYYGSKQEPLRMLMHGAAGTGKTVVVRLLRELLDRYGKGSEILFLAPTGKAASAIGGQTQHAAFALSITKKRRQTSNEDLEHDQHPASAKRIKYLQDKFRNIRWIFFDEVSMTSSEIMSEIDQSLQIGTQNFNEPFGGVNVIFAGDLCQLPPVASTPLYTTNPGPRHSSETRSKIVMGRGAWLAVATVVEFAQQMRMKDADMAAVLARLRLRKCLPEDADLFNNNVLQPVQPSQRDSVPHADAIVLGRTNESVRVINNRKAQAQADRKSSALMISHALDTATTALDIAVRRTLLSYNGNSMDRGAWGRVPLYIGMPVIYRGPNHSVTLGVANGAPATVAGWDLYQDEHGLTVPRGISLRFSEDATWNVTGLHRGCLPIEPVSSRFKFTGPTPGSPPFLVSRKQLPIRPAFAMTIHSAQGITTKTGIIVDLREGGFEAYVAASRATARQHVFLVAPVTVTGLNSPPLPPALVEELDRLALLAASTQAKHGHDDWRLEGFLKRSAQHLPTDRQKRQRSEARPERMEGAEEAS